MRGLQAIFGEQRCARPVVKVAAEAATFSRLRIWPRRRRERLSRASLGGATEVAMMKPADHRLSDDAAALRRLDVPRNRRIVVQRLMRARRMIVREVLR